MEKNLTLEDLERMFQEAQETKAKYIGVLINMIGCDEPEIIINPRANFDSKINYYKNAYNDNLTLKANSNIKIIDFIYGNSFDCIEYDLLTRR